MLTTDHIHIPHIRVHSKPLKWEPPVFPKVFMSHYTTWAARIHSMMRMLARFSRKIVRQRWVIQQLDIIIRYRQVRH